MNKLAVELNENLKGSVVDALLSDMGRRLYFPNGIISQGISYLPGKSCSS
jgi:hypothetical protein